MIALEALWKKFAKAGLVEDKEQDFKYPSPQLFWEVYLANALMHREFKLSRPGTKDDGGLDFLANDSIYIEAVCPEPGSYKLGGVPAPTINECDSENPKKPFIDEVPCERIRLRFTSAISEKIKQYKNHKKNKKNKNFIKDNPFVIAINGSCAKNGFNEDDINGRPHIVSVLLGLGSLYVSFNKETSKIDGYGLTSQPSIKKHNTESHDKKEHTKKDIKTDLFTNDKLKFISGILYSDITRDNLQMPLGRDFIFIPNPFATKNVVQNFEWCIYKDKDKDI